MLMKNYKTHLANFQKQALGNFNWEKCQSNFWQIYKHMKVSRWIRRDLRIGILQDFLGNNTMVQSIKANQSQGQSYNVSNRGTGQSRHLSHDKIM